ncbi:LysR family transcriptional regulator [Kineococcus rubinsiae]|uniref:LysR family transcriptional regulator n=1 Tax=Kineococcus rubinsiae TaxID=2609562 RepID=UPI00142FE2AD|nr:LysR substrate-binding domain-containing protein [Kineococcus rubinsiae]NIZ92140.1 LysR family transcriptional regulator [Kineococcus rubinsiae]
MTLTQLRAFLAAATTASFTAAARELQLSQPSVSELVRRLEEESGTALFVRGGRRLLLTEAGKELRPFAEQSVAAADGGAAAMRSLSSLGGGVASFGLLRNADYYLLSDLVERFHERYPQVRARLIGQNSVEVAAAVAGGELEAGLVVLPVDDAGLDVTPLMRDEVVYASADPTHLQRPVTTEDLAAARLIVYDAHYGWQDPTRRQVAERARLAGVRVEGLIEVEHVEAALKLVARGIGDTFVCRAVAGSPGFPPELGVVEFAEPLYDTVALVMRSGSVLSPATREIARLATEMLLGTG